MSRNEQKLRTFTEMCLKLSELSHDPKFKVAALIITDDFREICAMGYNGDYKGGPNVRADMDPGKSGFLHGEENALYHLCKPYELRSNLIMICTHKPCPMCAKRIVNSGIRRVYWVNDYTNLGPGTDEVFLNGKVECSQVPWAEPNT